jgi:putative transposase
MSGVEMCEVAGFSRSGYYRFLDPVKPAPADMDLRDEIQKIA